MTLYEQKTPHSYFKFLNIKPNRLNNTTLVYVENVHCISQCKRTNCAQIHHWVRYVNWWSLRNHLEPYTALANYIHFPLELMYVYYVFAESKVVVLDYSWLYLTIHSPPVCFVLSKVLVNFWCINLILSVLFFIEFSM